MSKNNSRDSRFSSGFSLHQIYNGLTGDSSAIGDYSYTHRLQRV